MSAEFQMSRDLTTMVPVRAHGPASAPAAPAASPAAPDDSVTRIVPRHGWQLVNVRELWAARELLYFLTWRDVKVRYKQAALGAAWAIIQPAMTMVVFTILFGRMVKVDTGGIPYAPFSYLGLVAWTFFATAVSNAGNSVVGSERIITKIYFPRLCIPFASVGAAVVDLLLASSLVVVMMVWYGIMPSAQMVVLPLVVLTILLLAAGVGTFLAALNVTYRDFRYVIPFLVQLWMFATPSVYMRLETAMAGKHAGLLSLNPMTWLIATFRDACIGRPIHWGQFGMAFVASAAAFAAGCFYFRRTEEKFADII